MMFIFGNFFLAVAQILDLLLTLLIYLIFFRAIISWVNPDPYNPIVQFLYKTTEPLLDPIRRFLPMGRIDFSPMIAFVLIIFLQSFLVASLRDLGYYMHSPRPAAINIPASRGHLREIPSQAADTSEQIFQEN